MGLERRESAEVLCRGRVRANVVGQGVDGAADGKIHRRKMQPLSGRWLLALRFLRFLRFLRIRALPGGGDPINHCQKRAIIVAVVGEERGAKP